jgi:hypothetical protein
MLPMAPSSTVLSRLPSQLAAVLRQHRVDEAMIVQECSSTVDYRLSTTANRSLLGSMNEFIHLARDYRQDPDLNLIDLSMQLSTVPCGPLFGRHVSPNREVHAVIQSARP